MSIAGMGREVFGCSLVMLAVGCSSTDETAACDPATETCDVTLDPPTAGFQLVAGPVEVPKGTEVLRCWWVKVPDDYDISRFEIRYNTGSHHLDVFTVPYEMPDGQFDCDSTSQGSEGSSEVGGLDPSKPRPSLVVGFQNETVDWTLPEGVAFHLTKGQQLIIQSHFANIAVQDTPTSRMYNLLNFHAIEGPVTDAAETIFDEDDDIYLPAKTETTLTRYCRFPEPMNVISMTGHFHSRGKLYQVFPWDPVTNEVGPEMYTNTNWDEPPVYKSGVDWSTAPVVPGLKMVATYYNFEDRDIVWGNYAGENEHFETFVSFYPAQGLDAECQCWREGGEPECEDGEEMNE